MIWAGSSQTSSASSNATWCLRRLAAALSSSHSNITKLPVLTLSCIHCSRARCNAEPCGHNKPRFDAKRSDERDRPTGRSEEHTYELQSLMRIWYADFCL